MFIIYTYIYNIQYCVVFPLFITRSVHALGLYYNGRIVLNSTVHCV